MRTLILVLLFVLVGCGEKVTPEPRAGEVHYLPPIEWRVVDRDTLRAAYQNSGMKLEEKDQLHGFVGTRDGNWVVYTLPPKRVDGPETCTLGHEILHVALGDYHD